MITSWVVHLYHQGIIDGQYFFDTMLLENASGILTEAQLASLAEQQIADREREQRQMQYQLDNGGVSGGRGGFGGFGGGRGGFGGRGGGGGGNRGGR